MTWKAPDRNFDKIQFELLRKLIDGKFNQVHDELSDCFYNGKPFRTFGILTKEQFDKFHGLIFAMRDITFHQENLKLPSKDQIPEEEYNALTLDDEGKIATKKTDLAQTMITDLQEFNLVI